jgi:predicted aspartyl protease
MQAYDKERFSPPAPLALVTCKHPDSGATWVDMPMLIDTGADVSLLPQKALEKLSLSAVPDRRYELVGFDGNLSTAPVVRAVVVFCGRTFRGQYLLIEQEYGILGRNLLNAVPLLLDGPRAVWGEQKRAT